MLAFVSGFSCGCLLRFSVSGRNKETSNSIVKKEESSNLQALIQEAAVAEDGQLGIVKGKDRHDTDGSLSLGSGRLPDGWTSPSVSTT